MKVGIDIDSTTCDMVPSIVAMANERLGTSYTVQNVDRWDYVFKNDDGDHCHLTNLIGEAFATPGFLESLPTVDGAYECVEALASMDGGAACDITFITNRNPKHAAATVKWLDFNIGEYPIIFAKDAKQHGLDVLIDDAPHHIQNFAGRTPIVYDQPWNQKVGFKSNRHKRYVQRAKSWPQIVEFVEEAYCNE